MVPIQDSTTLLVRTPKSQVKIEPNTIVRGTVFPAKELPPVSKAQAAFETALEVSCLDEDELYAGKICAALDRQHPRDLFDMQDFFSFRKLTERLGKAMVIYIASSPRPMHELLSPNIQDISKTFVGEFQGMTVNPVKLDELLETRTKLFSAVIDCLPAKGKEFLIILKSAEPRWELIELILKRISRAVKKSDCPLILFHLRILHSGSNSRLTLFTFPSEAKRTSRR